MVLNTQESLIGHSGWDLPHYTEMGHSSSIWGRGGKASPGRGSNPQPPVPVALNIPEGHLSCRMKLKTILLEFYGVAKAAQRFDQELQCIAVTSNGI